MYHSSDNYFGSRIPALNFFCQVPFGMTADELSSWITFGGGQELWDEVDAPFNIKPFLCMNQGVQMGGWLARRSTAPPTSRACVIGCRASARRCCAAWAPLS